MGIIRSMLMNQLGILHMVVYILRRNIIHTRQDGADMLGTVDVTSRYGDLDAVILLRIIHVNKTTPWNAWITLPVFFVFLQSTTNGFKVREPFFFPF